MMEAWCRVPGHSDHIVSNMGRVRHRRVGAPILKGYIDRDGYRRVRLDGKEERVHRLVCLAFHGDPPANTVCAHTDGDPLNNAATNLRWATQKENVADCIGHGKFSFPRVQSGERHPMAKLSDADISRIHELLAEGISQRSIAKVMGVSQGHICHIGKGRSRPQDIAQDPSRSAASSAGEG